MRRLGVFDDGEPGPELTRDVPADRALVRRAGAEAMVVLRNQPAGGTTALPTPAFEHHPGRNGVANYLEARLIGYRWYDTVGRQPLFPFGFGLGYADVTITAARASGDATQPTSVDVELANGSDRDGMQVVQVYAAHTGGHPASVERRGDEPAQQLIGFAKVGVPAHGTATVTVQLNPRAMHTWSIGDHDWVRAPGPFELRIGTSSRDIAASIPVG